MASDFFLWGGAWHYGTLWQSMADQAALCFPRLRQPLPGHGLLPRGRSSVTLVTVLSALLLVHTLLYVKAYSFFVSLSLSLCVWLSLSVFFLWFIFCCIYYVIIFSIICFKIKCYGGQGVGGWKSRVYNILMYSVLQVHWQRWWNQFTGSNVLKSAQLHYLLPAVKWWGETLWPTLSYIMCPILMSLLRWSTCKHGFFGA